MNPLKIAILVPVLAALSACSSKPGDADLHEALYRQMEIAGGKDTANSMKEPIKATRIIDCTKAGEGKAYQCDVIGLFGAAQSVRMVKSDQGWTLID